MRILWPQNIINRIVTYTLFVHVAISLCFFKKIDFFYVFELFDELILKIKKNKKNIILIYF